LGCDIVGVSVSFILAYILKFKLTYVTQLLFGQSSGPFYGHAQVEPYIGALWVLNLVAVLAMQFFGGYRSPGGVMPEIDECLNVVKSMVLVVVSSIFIHFFLDVVPGSRVVLLYFLGISIVFVSVMRLCVLAFETWCYRRGIGVKRVLIIGVGMRSQNVAERIIMSPALGFQYVGFIADAPPENIHYHLKDCFKLLGTAGHIEPVCREHDINTIFIIERDMAQATLRRMMAFATDQGIQVHLLSESLLNTPFVEAGVFDGVPMMSSVVQERSIVSRVLKRCFDILFSVVMLVGLLPVLGAMSLWIKSVSPKGGVLYKQERVGQNGKRFFMLKFRSMVPEAELGTGPTMVDEANETRYIRGGQCLRQWSLDELPQLWNIFVGEMSLVGPRPERPHFVDQFSQRVPFFLHRHAVPVGLTGWAQVNGRSVLTRRPEHKIKYDIYYINHWSLIFDFKILVKTLFVVLKKEESY
jgi:exopolysaccharide biosynthesis polyprenyl glycosylphosphotransferase